jgi:hypothetical protein
MPFLEVQLRLQPPSRTATDPLAGQTDTMAPAGATFLPPLRSDDAGAASVDSLILGWLQSQVALAVHVVRLDGSSAGPGEGLRFGCEELGFMCEGLGFRSEDLGVNQSCALQKPPLLRCCGGKEQEQPNRKLQTLNPYP